MNRIVSALALALSLVSLSATALAEPSQKAPAAHHKQGHKGKADRDEKSFPMKADDFKKMVAERVGKAREHMEKHISKKNIDADKAKELRAKFDAGVVLLNRKVDQVSADGTVTKEEYKEVRELVQQMTQQHRKAHARKPKK